MLPAALRLTRPDDFARAIRRGRRAGRRSLVVHLLYQDDNDHPARAGLVVSRAVGGSVVRHRVSRRLRHLLREELAGLATGSLLVVRAHPAAAASSYAQLREDLSSALRAAARRPSRTGHTGTTTVESRTGTSERGVCR